MKIFKLKFNNNKPKCFSVQLENFSLLKLDLVQNDLVLTLAPKDVGRGFVLDINEIKAILNCLENLRNGVREDRKIFQNSSAG